METLLIYKGSISIALIIGLSFGLLSRFNFLLTAILGAISTGILTLLLTGDWRHFFRDGFTLFHVIYGAGHMVTSIGLFGPVGALAASLAGILRRYICRRCVKGSG